jgi:arylamine N-acetyltransferase
MSNENYPMCSVSAYLERIGFVGEAKPDVKTLFALQEQHVLSIPYENLEIMQRKPITLDVPALYDKMITRKRGGYCFELNGLFAWLLEEIGFTVIQHFGRWVKGEPLRYPERRHRILRVPLDGKEYICDVGVGMAAPRWPLVFQLYEEQEQFGAVYRIVPDEIDIYDVQVKKEDGWDVFYSFNDDPCIAIDYMQAHYYCITHPDSRFINETMVCIETPEGHTTVSDDCDPETGEKVRKMRIHRKDGVNVVLLRGDKQFRTALQEHFGIDIDS